MHLLLKAKKDEFSHSYSLLTLIQYGILAHRTESHQLGESSQLNKTSMKMYSEVCVSDDHYPTITAKLFLMTSHLSDFDSEVLVSKP